MNKTVEPANQHRDPCISPSETINQTRRCYLDGSLILITVFDTDSGSVELTDFMPVQQGGSHVVRLIRGLRGTVKMQLSLRVRFGYGRAVPWTDKLGRGELSFVAGPDMLVHRGEDLVGQFYALRLGVL
jgi:hypothetical protein